MILNRIRKAISFCLHMVLVSFLVESCSSAPSSEFPQAHIIHSIDSLNHLEPLWSQSDIYVGQNDFEPALSASSELVCFLGDTSFPPKNVISCIHPISREVVWQKFTGAPSGISVVNQETLVSYNGTKGIEKYNAKGDVVWSRALTGILYTYLYENQVQLFMHPERFLVINFIDGTTIKDVRNVDIIFSTPTESFVKNLNLESWSVDMSQINWSIEIGNKVRLAPVITDDFVFFRTGQTIGSIYSVNRVTGEMLWQTNNSNIISNVVYLSQKKQILALTRDGKLISIDAQSGEQTIWGKFSKAPFVLNGEEIVGGYELAYDEKSKVIYLLLGDSRQLFAFQVD